MFEFLDGYTYPIKSVNVVQIKATKSDWEKKQATLMVIIFEDGIARVAPSLIFKGVSHSERKRVNAEREIELWEEEIA